MKFIFLFLIIFSGVNSAMAGNSTNKVSDNKISAPAKKTVFEFNNQKYSLLQDEQAASEELSNEKVKKSGMLAALFSAVVPGAGEFYAESYWKSALFVSIEIASWAAYLVYSGKGKDKDKEMRNYGDQYWSETRYWSKVYAKANNTTVVLLSEGDLNNPVFMSQLREMEADPQNGFTHTLPSTKTQQYYEMIYKYLSQFGAGWNEVDGNWNYYDNGANQDNLLPNVVHYRNLRNRSNELYDVAAAMATAAMLNHVVSAFDAAFTVKFYNKELNYSIGAEAKHLADEQVVFYGLNFIW